MNNSALTSSAGGASKRQYSGRGDLNVNRFKRRDLTIEVEDSNADPERQHSQSRKSGAASLNSPADIARPGNMRRVKIPAPSPALDEPDPLNLKQKVDAKTKKKQKKLKEKAEELEDEMEHQEKVMKRMQKNEREQTRLRRCVRFFNVVNALACCIFCADFWCKVAYYRGHQFESPDVKKVFLLFLLIRPLGLFMVFTYNLIAEINWLGEGMDTLLRLEKRPSRPRIEE